MLFRRFAREIRGGEAVLKYSIKRSVLQEIATHNQRTLSRVNNARNASTQADQSRERGKAGGGAEDDSNSFGSARSFFNSTGFETAMGASLGVLLLGGAAILYQAFYKARVLKKMEAAFDGGYDPVLALVENGKEMAYVHVHPPRPEEDLIDSIISGNERGRYFLILGSKGSGKTTMLIQAMSRHRAEGCAFFEAHPDPSIVVDRFSEAINFSMNRDYLGNLLGLSDLSGMSVYQQVERALHKLEKALIRYSQRAGRPAVIVMNSAHLLPNDGDGQIILSLFQQRAEKWASAGTATFVITSNDYWVFDVLRKNSNRMDTLTFTDLNRCQAIETLRRCREFYFGLDVAAQEEKEGILEAAYEVLGGRVGLINSAARRRRLLNAVNQMVEDDMQWILSKTGLIEDHDDDVSRSEKWSTCSWLLFVELAKRQAALEASNLQSHRLPLHHNHIAGSSAEGEKPLHLPSSGALRSVVDPSQDIVEDVRGRDVPNPHLTWGETRQIMTRPDFISELDRLNLIHIDRHHHIRADSMPLLRAFRRVAEIDGYEDKLERVMDRVSAIESLNRTRELLWKEQGDGGKIMLRHDGKGREIESWTLLGGDERLGRSDDEETGLEETS
ncbi:hypothetical protein CBS101457_001154 [Exobasidium rhododendri]|nr:hypothetical protein CBS101457_001154 [Exobasidium rhododendri]